MIQGLSGGSEGLLTGRYSQYWNTGKVCVCVCVCVCAYLPTCLPAILFETHLR